MSTFNIILSKVFDSNDNKMLDVFGDDVGLRVDSLRRQTYPSTYLDIDEEQKQEWDRARNDFRGSKASLGLISTHSSQHLSMGDVEAKSYKMLSSNDELDETSISVRYKNYIYNFINWLINSISSNGFYVFLPS